MQDFMLFYIMTDLLLFYGGMCRSWSLTVQVLTVLIWFEEHGKGFEAFFPGLLNQVCAVLD